MNCTGIIDVYVHGLVEFSTVLLHVLGVCTCMYGLLLHFLVESGTMLLYSTIVYACSENHMVMVYICTHNRKYLSYTRKCPDSVYI